MKDLTEIFKDINPKDWEKIAMVLRIPGYRVEEIKKECSTDEERWAAMLKEYVTDHPLASWLDVRDAMAWFGYKSVADEIFAKFLPSSTRYL